MSKELEINCPKCKTLCAVDVGSRDLTENSTTEGFEAECANCGCCFQFDVYVDIMNKQECLDGEG